MNSDEPSAHFAWDLLDSAKQVAALRATETQLAEKPAAAAAEPQPQAPDAPDQPKPTADGLPVSTGLPEPESEGLPSNGQPPATAIIGTDAATAIEEPSSAPLQPEPTVEQEPASARVQGEAGRLPILGQQPLSVRSNGDIPKLGWNDVGMATEPGQYKSRYGLVQVRADEIWIWKMHPNATFVVMQPSPYSDQDVSRLGSFDLGNQEHFSRDEK